MNCIGLNLEITWLVNTKLDLQYKYKYKIKLAQENQKRFVNIVIKYHYDRMNADRDKLCLDGRGPLTQPPGSDHTWPKAYCLCVWMEDSTLENLCPDSQLSQQ